MSSQKRLYRIIYEEITRLIASGDFPANSRLPTERELAERFDVSRPTIREAFIALEVTNKVSIKTGSGVYVLEQPGHGSTFDSEITPFEVLEARVLLESESAALAAKMITEEEIELLRVAFSELEAESKTDQDSNSSKADRKFHTIIANASHNRVFAKQIHSLWEIQENLQHIKSAHQAVCASQGEKRIREHKAILDSIVERNASAARISMRNHFSNVLETMHSTMEEHAIEEARRKGSEMRERFSLGRLTAAELKPKE